MRTNPTSSGPSARVGQAIQEAAAARQAGRYREALERVRAASALLAAGPVRRELRVSLEREAGLACIGLDRPREARDRLMLALERAGSEGALADPVRAALAALELMGGELREARRWLSERGRDRRATLLAQARLELAEGHVAVAEQALQACEQAPGGTSGVAPPSSALRSLAAIWQGRPDQARMLLDGVASTGNAHWELARLLSLRAVWVQGGDGRYLDVALSTTEELRFGDRVEVRPPGLAALIASQHALLLHLRGETELALDAAHTAEAQLGTLMIPEWPLPAILHDLAVVYRAAGDDERWQAVADRYADLDPGPWPARARLVTGPRADDALSPRRRDGVDSGAGHGGALARVALAVLEGGADPCGALLGGLAETVGAHGGRWHGADGRVLARLGTALLPGTPAGPPVVLEVGQAGAIELFGAAPPAVARLDRGYLEGVARAARERLSERRASRALADAVRVAETGRAAAEEALERSRRPGSAVVVGGRFRSVVGRSERLREVLDQLGVLAGMPGPILLDGPTGSGRRHLARALHAVEHEGVELPVVDVSLVPLGEQTATLQRLRAGALSGDWLVANAENLSPEACSWLIQATSEVLDGGGRALVTLDAGTEGQVPDALRSALAPGRVAIPGLDERLEDLPLLLDAFAREVGRRPDDVSTAARALLARRAWVGHVAELRTAVHQAAVRAEKATLLPEHFEAALPDAGVHLSESVELGYHDAVRSFRRELLVHALEVCGGNRTRAAELLGLQRTYFMRLIRDLGATEGETSA